jgi:hypothetical protein
MAGKFDDFLNPTSILTPGIAMVVARPLAFSFGWSIPTLVLVEKMISVLRTQ